jgi:hypothetical protein
LRKILIDRIIFKGKQTSLPMFVDVLSGCVLSKQLPGQLACMSL